MLFDDVPLDVLWGTRSDRRALVRALEEESAEPILSPADARSRYAFPSFMACQTMTKARTLLQAQGLYLGDVAYDGSCVVHAVRPTITASLGRPATEHEVRQLLVDEMHDPRLRADVMKDWHQTAVMAAVQHERAAPSLEEHLAQFRVPKTYLPPIIAAKAVEQFTGGSVQLLTMVGSADIAPLYVSDAGAPYACRFFYEDTIKHAGILYPLPRVAYADNGLQQAQHLQAAATATVSPPLALPVAPPSPPRRTHFPMPVNPILKLYVDPPQ